MSMNIYSQPGTKVIFLDKNGTDSDRENAERILKVGQIYTVKSINVQSWISYVTLKEVPNRMFNSVMFENTDSE